MTLLNCITIAISILALVISAFTFWLTRVKRGDLKMTKPTIIFFGPDGGGENRNKVFIRTLLYSTSERGQYIQNMFIRLTRGEVIQNFNVWVYDDKGLVRGSGMFVSKNGIACNHHFLLPKDVEVHLFSPGNYLLQVFVEPVESSLKMIFEQRLILTNEQSSEMKSQGAGVYFDWAPNSQNYFSHVDIKPKGNQDILDLIKVINGEKK